MLKREITKIILELKQIKLLLKNKNSIEVDDNTGQIASTVQGNQIQNNNYLFTQNRKIIEFKYDKNEELKNKEEVLPKFLHYFLNRTPQLTKYDNGVDQTNLRKDQILNIQIRMDRLLLH